MPEWDAETKKRMTTMAHAMQSISGGSRVLTVVTLALDHGTGADLVGAGYTGDPNQIAEDLIRALVVACRGREVRISIDGAEVEIGKPKDRQIAELIWGKHFEP